MLPACLALSSRHSWHRAHCQQQKCTILSSHPDGSACGAARPCRKVRGKAHNVMQSRNGRQREGSHAQMPRTFRLNLLRIEERLREVTQQVMAQIAVQETMHPVQ